MTDKQSATEKIKNEIDGMSHFGLCDLWRNAPSGSPYFQGEVGDYFKKVLFEKNGGFTPKISKLLK